MVKILICLHEGPLHNILTQIRRICEWMENVIGQKFNNGRTLAYCAKIFSKVKLLINVISASFNTGLYFVIQSTNMFCLLSVHTGQI